MKRRAGWNVALIWIGLVLMSAVLWLACIGGGWVVVR